MSSEKEKDESISRMAVIVDVMAAVNKININNDEINDCAGFASKFMERMNNQASKFEENTVMSVQYDEKSLTGNTRVGQNKVMAPIKPYVTDTTGMRHRNIAVCLIFKNKERFSKSSCPKTGKMFCYCIWKNGLNTFTWSRWRSTNLWSIKIRYRYLLGSNRCM